MKLRSAADIPGDVTRVSDVVRVLMQYQLAGWLEGTEFAPVRRALTSQGGQVLTDHPKAVRLRLALADLGTTFIKLGQILGTRPDLVGPELAAELARLQDATPADPPEVAVATVERELSRPINECFAEFDRNAMASASIAQVHRAKLHNGRRVVVKVQHSGIEGPIHRDLNILAKLAVFAERQDDLKRYRPTQLVNEFAKTLQRELDFRSEMRNLLQFRRNFASDKTVVFPRPYPALSTGRVLTMQMLGGISVRKVEKLKSRKIDPEVVARQGANVFVQMILRDGFYHADPHPGNLLALSNGRVGILDAGMVGRLDEELREQVVEMIVAAADMDAQRLTDVICVICKAPPGLDRSALSADLSEVFADYGTQALDRFNVGGALTEVTNLLHEYNVFMPSRLSMLIKCLIVLEGTGKGLNASFSLAELLQPYRHQFEMEQISPDKWMRKGKRWERDWQMLAQSVPRNISGLLEQLKIGHLTIRNRHRPLEASVNRLAYGLCISALLLASAMLWVHQIPPTIRGVSLLGPAGYLFAALLGMRLLWQIRRENRKDD